MYFVIESLRGAMGLRVAVSRVGRSLRWLVLLSAASAALSLGACTHQGGGSWQLYNVEGHLPDLNFSLTDDDGKSVTGASFNGRTNLVYFGYTHCPDVCPETLARLMQVLEKLGDDARDVRVLFISVDPARDTPQALHGYVSAFDAQHIVGLAGSHRETEELARRYRVAFQMEKPKSDGNYDVTHSSLIYVFDRNGRARLLATDSNSIDMIVHDLKQLIGQTS
jgi:protein SCO1/2